MLRTRNPGLDWNLWPRKESEEHWVRIRVDRMGVEQGDRPEEKIH